MIISVSLHPSFDWASLPNALCFGLPMFLIVLRIHPWGSCKVSISAPYRSRLIAKARPREKKRIPQPSVSSHLWPCCWSTPSMVLAAQCPFLCVFLPDCRAQLFLSSTKLPTVHFSILFKQDLKTCETYFFHFIEDIMWKYWLYIFECQSQWE